MPARVSGIGVLNLLVTTCLVAITAAVVIFGAWTDRASRATGPEEPFATYVTALAERDLTSALDQISPSSRDSARSFVEWQLGNRYVLLESAVKARPLLERLAGSEIDSAELIVTIDVMEEGGSTWRVTEAVPVVLVAEQWYLERPPLQPAS